MGLLMGFAISGGKQIEGSKFGEELQVEFWGWEKCGEESRMREREG